MTALACSPTRPGWQRLWAGEWTRAEIGDRWEMAVPAAGRRLDVVRPAQLRTDLLNPGPAAATVRLVGPSATREWTVPARATVPVQVSLGTGSYRFAAPDGVMAGSPRLGRPLRHPRLIVLALVDTLRADHVSPELTPRLLSTFRHGRRFADVSSAAPWTLPSLATLFTARPVLDLTTPEGDLIGPPRGLATLPQAFDAAGFLGAAVVANYTVHVRNGFAEGFATYLVPDGHGVPGLDAGWVVGNARALLAEHAGEELFLYLHFMDVHEPYRDHTGAGRVMPELGPLAHRRRGATAAEATLLRDLYAGEVRYLDQALAPFLDDLPASAVIALTADHGESLGEHGCWGHGLSLYQPELAVPLLLEGPGVRPGDEPKPLQLVDLAPTLLELAKVTPPRTMLGHSLLRGGSALPAVSVTFSAGPMRWAWRHGSEKVLLHLAPQPGLGATSRTVMEEGHPLPAGTFRFDLDRDPGEEHPAPLDGELLAAAGNAFAATAGRLVPGLQLLIWGVRGPAACEVGWDGRLEPIQAWGTGPLRLEPSGGKLRLECVEGFPVCAVAGTMTGGGPLRPLPGAVPWQGVAPGGAVAPSSAAPPAVLSPGHAALWLNPSRQRLVDAYRETIERLKALGYLE